MGGGDRVGMAREHFLRGGKMLNEWAIGGCEMTYHVCLMDLCAAGQHGGDECDADAATEVAGEVVEAGGVAELLLGQLAHRRRGQRHENEADGDAVEDA